MKFEAKTNKDVTIVDIEGELNITSSMEFKKEINQIIDKGCKKIAINFDKISYMDSSGLGICVTIQKRLKQEGGKMRFFKMAKPILKIFEMTSLDKFFVFSESEEAAVKSLND